MRPDNLVYRGGHGQHAEYQCPVCKGMWEPAAERPDEAQLAERPWESAWKPDYTITPRRVVCAAIRKGARTILGARHFDNRMHEQIVASEGHDFWREADQGFIDQFGEFMTREEAWEVAEARGQILRECSSPGALYSENLY